MIRARPWVGQVMSEREPQQCLRLEATSLAWAAAEAGQELVVVQILAAASTELGPEPGKTAPDAASIPTHAAGSRPNPDPAVPELELPDSLRSRGYRCRVETP
jgi:hypothetical protein